MRSIIKKHSSLAAALLMVVVMAGCSSPESVAPDSITIGGTGVEGPFDTAIKAAYDGNLDYVKQCVESDAAYVQSYDDRGRTLLHYAAEGGHEDIVKYLLEHGAYASAQDNDGYTPVEAAGEGTGSMTVINLLREAQGRENGAQ